MLSPFLVLGMPSTHDESLSQPLDLSTVEITRLRGLNTSDIVSLVDEEESKAIRHILALRSIRNTIAPAIRRLPDEVILRIMVFFKEAHRSKSMLSPSLFDYQFSPTWTSITQVCRRWRAIGLMTPTLWTDISWIPLRKTLNQLSRSRTSPLYVVLESCILGMPDSQRFVEALAPHASRVVVFDACLSLRDLRTLATSFVEPFFQSLTFLGLEDDEKRLRGSTCGQIPITVPVNHTVRDLKLQGVYIPWDSHIFRGLKTLTLRDQETEDSRPYMQTFLDILEANPELTALTIRNAGPRAEPTMSSQTPSLRKVKLDFLTKLELSLQSHLTVQLIGYLCVPDTTYVSLGYSLDDIYRADAVHETGGDYAAALPRGRHWSECLSSIDSIVIAFKDVYEHTADYSVEGKVGERKCFDFHFQGSNQLDHAALDFRSSVGSIFQSSPITSLKLSIQMLLSPEQDWSTLFRYFERTTHLELSFPSPSTCHQHFDEFWQAFGFPDSPHDFIFPHLKSLKFDGMGMNVELGQLIRSSLLERLQSDLPRLHTLELHRVMWIERGKVQWPEVEGLVDEFSCSLFDWNAERRRLSG